MPEYEPDDWDVPPAPVESHATSTVPESKPAAKSAALDTLPPPSHTKVKTGEYISSSVSLDGCPPERYPEFAVIGRSNVGKSSLINMLTNMKGLALVSKQPGKTKCINHFLINNSWYLVDLPGYGFAKTGSDNKVEWAAFTQDYFLRRQTLVNVLMLVDASVPPQVADLECVRWMGDAEIPFSICFTKVDKKKKRKKAPASHLNMDAFKDILLQEWETLPTCLETSALTGVGREVVLRHISQLRQLHLSAVQAATA